MATPRVHQPIHPDILPKLLPEYVQVHNTYNLYTPNIHTLEWNPAVRQNAPVIGGSEPLQVGKVEDIPLSACTMRLFTPEGTPPSDGWPVFLFVLSRRMDVGEHQHRKCLLHEYVQT